MPWQRKTNPKRKKQKPVRRPVSEMVNLLDGTVREEDREVPHQANDIAKSLEDKEVNSSLHF
mgnify:FL=1